MKLVLKRLPRMMVVRALEDGHPKFVEAGSENTGPFALHTEDGQILPCQVSTTMNSSGRFDPVQLTVTFTVDGTNIRVEGDPVES
jgi:hypothetical protein